MASSRSQTRMYDPGALLIWAFTPIAMYGWNLHVRNETERHARVRNSGKSPKPEKMSLVEVRAKAFKKPETRAELQVAIYLRRATCISLLLYGVVALCVAGYFVPVPDSRLFHLFLFALASLLVLMMAYIKRANRFDRAATNGWRTDSPATRPDGREWSRMEPSHWDWVPVVLCSPLLLGVIDPKIFPWS